MSERIAKPFKIYPWDMSATGQWTPTWLKFLKEESVGNIVSVLKSGGVGDYGIAIDECYAYGYLRKAAEITRLIIKDSQEVLEFVNTTYEDPVRKRLLTERLEDIPSSPIELSKLISIQYIN